MENSFLSQASKQKIDISSVTDNSLEQTKFCLLNNFVFYFNSGTNKKEIDLYIENNFELLQELFQSIKKTFIIVNDQNITSSEIQTLKYYFPTFQTNSKSYNISQILLDYFDYSGVLQTGLIVHNSTFSYGAEISIIGLDQDLTSTQLDLFFQEYFTHIKSNNGYLFEPLPFELNLYFQPIEFIPDEIEFENEDKEEIQKIIDKLNQIKNKGNFIALLPVLEKYLHDQEQKIVKISRLYIDLDYKIWLIDYNLEVKLSHLTKAIYFLFLFRNHKIDLSDFKLYKKELLKIYISISNQENLGKMIQSVDLLITDKNSIYVHLSRIKSTFHKLVYKDIAEHYCIQGAKYKSKGINIKRNLTNIEDYREIWFPQKPRTIKDIANDNDALSL